VSLEDADGRLQKVVIEQIVLMERERIFASSRAYRLKHVAHRAQARWIPQVAHARVPQRSHILPILVRRSIIEQRELEIAERLREDGFDTAAGLRQLLVARDVD